MALTLQSKMKYKSHPNLFPFNPNSQRLLQKKSWNTERSKVKTKEVWVWYLALPQLVFVNLFKTLYYFSHAVTSVKLGPKLVNLQYSLPFYNCVELETDGWFTCTSEPNEVKVKKQNSTSQAAYIVSCFPWSANSFTCRNCLSLTYIIYYQLQLYRQKKGRDTMWQSCAVLIGK
jgi:hypothetical protein